MGEGENATTDGEAMKPDSLEAIRGRRERVRNDSWPQAILDRVDLLAEVDRLNRVVETMAQDITRRMAAEGPGGFADLEPPARTLNVRGLSDEPWDNWHCSCIGHAGPCPEGETRQAICTVEFSR